MIGMKEWKEMMDRCTADNMAATQVMKTTGEIEEPVISRWSVRNKLISEMIMKKSEPDEVHQWSITKQEIDMIVETYKSRKV